MGGVKRGRGTEKGVGKYRETDMEWREREKEREREREIERDRDRETERQRERRAYKNEIYKLSSKLRSILKRNT